MNDSPEYLGPERSAGRDDEPRRWSQEQAFRIAVVVLLLVTAFSSSATYLLAREQAADTRDLNCLNLSFGVARDDAGEIDDATRQMAEVMGCDLDELQNPSP